MTKEEIIIKFGRGDGLDEARFDQVVITAGLIDRSVALCFEHLINLEDKGLIELKVE